MGGRPAARPPITARRWRPTAALALRMAALVGGGYAAASGLVALVATALVRADWTGRGEAVNAAGMTGFLVYLALILWIAAERDLRRAVAGPLVLAALGHGGALLLARLGEG